MEEGKDQKGKTMTFDNIVWEDCYDGVGGLVGYGDYELSIVSHSRSYGGTSGLYEIMVIYKGKQKEMKGITNEGDTVKGYLSESDVSAIMKKMTSLTGKDGQNVGTSIH